MNIVLATAAASSEPPEAVKIIIGFVLFSFLAVLVIRHLKRLPPEKFKEYGEKLAEAIAVIVTVVFVVAVVAFIASLFKDNDKET